jgi:hypothetical protein
MSQKKSRVVPRGLPRTLWRHVLSWLNVYHHARAARSCRQLYEAAQDPSSWAPTIRWSSHHPLDLPAKEIDPEDKIRDWPTLRKLWTLDVEHFALDHLLLMKLQTLQLHFYYNVEQLSAMEILSVSCFRTVRHLHVRFSSLAVPSRYLKHLEALPLETLVIQNLLKYDNAPFPAWPHLRHLSLQINDDLFERG